MISKSGCRFSEKIMLKHGVDVARGSLEPGELREPGPDEQDHQENAPDQEDHVEADEPSHGVVRSIDIRVAVAHRRTPADFPKPRQALSIPGRRFPARRRDGTSTG